MADTDRAALLEEWRRRCTRWVRAHHAAARRYERFETVLTITNVIASLGVVCASVVVASTRNASELFIWIVLASSIVVVCMTIIQYIMDFRTKSHRHHHAATEYRAARRMVELARTQDAESGSIKIVDDALRTAEKLAPTIPHGLWKKYVGDHDAGSRTP